MLFNAGRMGSQLFIVVAVLVLVVCAVGRITYEQMESPEPVQADRLRAKMERLRELT